MKNQFSKINKKTSEPRFRPVRLRSEPAIVRLPLAFAVTWKSLLLVDAAAGRRRAVEAVAVGQRHCCPSPCGGSRHRAMKAVTTP
jgi:hypothetical protein